MVPFGQFRDLPGALRTFTETGDQINGNLQGIGHYVRPSRTYAALAGVTQSLGLFSVAVPAGASVTYGTPIVGSYLQWGAVYQYAVSILAPDGTETRVSTVVPIRTPSLPGAPIVTAESGAGAVWNVDRVYALSRQYMDTTGNVQETPVGPVSLATVSASVPKGQNKNWRLSVPHDPGQDAADPRSGGVSVYRLWRAAPPLGGGSGAINWAADGRVCNLHAGDSVLDDSIAATPTSPSTGNPRVSVQPTTPLPSPQHSFRVYGRTPDAMGLLVTQPAGSSAAWVDDGGLNPSPEVRPPLVSETPAEPTGRAYHPEDVFRFPFRSRLVVVALYDGPAYVQIGTGTAGESWEDELRVPGPGRTAYAIEAERLRIRTADAPALFQTRYRVEVWD